MSRWRKKRVVVEAWQFLRPTDCEQIPPWIDPAWFHGTPGGAHHSARYMRIPAPGGTLRADYTDWIIRGVNGEVYPCQADVFSATYERVG